MTSLAQLEEQINRLNVLNKVSGKALDAFADASNNISCKAWQIMSDVKPWEVARENIALMIEEMSKASRSYHPPPSLQDVLTQQEKNPEVIARCMDYLVYADSYLASHPSSNYADQIQRTINKQIQQIVHISEELVKRAFFQALQKPVNSTKGAGGRRYIIHNPDALRDINLIVQRLGENFGRNGVVQNDVYTMLQSKVRSFIEARLTKASREEGGSLTMSGNHANMPHMLKHYQRKDHPLLKISQMARESVQEVSDCINTFIIKPLDESYMVVEMPSQLASVPFDVVMDHAMDAISFDKTVFRNPTKMFVDSRGQGIELYRGKRYFRDIIFIGLDLIEEIWQWKGLAAALPGEHDTFIDYVNIDVKRYLGALRELLEGYATCKGSLEKEQLKEYAKSASSLEWLPSLDSAAHEITTNLLSFHKVLLATYYGSLKLSLQGSLVNFNDDDAAVRKIQEYLIRTLIGTLQELQVIVDVAVEMNKRHEEGGYAGGGGGGALSRSRISPQVFLLSNIIFLAETYKREPCFQKRLMPAEDGGVAAPKKSGRGAAKSASQLPITAQILAILEDEHERCVDEFEFSWEKCFPEMYEDPELSSIRPDPNEALTKSQRMALKRWNKSVARALGEKLENSKIGTCVSTTVRARLIEIAVKTVRKKFLSFDDLVRGRAWSTRPRKWILFSVEEWIQRIKNIL
ncbi:unnamed protein product [Phytomonas sp. EM1]|nr:unnamed protein product [Phytomonas sp. EM1]|eukprot:CCW64407.1 unnamed protein product [Phytomonas sp. isolate EM1]